jgi:hypothetical protein
MMPAMSNYAPGSKIYLLVGRRNGPRPTSSPSGCLAAGAATTTLGVATKKTGRKFWFIDAELDTHKLSNDASRGCTQQTVQLQKDKKETIRLEAHQIYDIKTGLYYGVMKEDT